MPAAVASQVDHQAVNTFLFEFRNQALDVLGRACVVLVAVTEGPVVPVKTGHINDADGPLPPMAGNSDDFAFRCLFLEFDQAFFV